MRQVQSYFRSACLKRVDAEYLSSLYARGVQCLVLEAGIGFFV